jgi:drug/metabolite transporter (DMT)-like permease
MAVALALVSAFMFGLGTVLQQRVAQEAEADQAMSPAFLLQLARQPAWLVGIAAAGGAYVVQAAALDVGRLVVVQPLMSTTLVFALPIGAALNHTKLGSRELGAAIAVSAGAALFLIASDPSGGEPDATTAGWLAAFLAAGAVAGGLVLAARGAAPAVRASCLGAACGILFALTAGLTKAVVELLHGGAGDVLTDWHVYALCVVGYAAMTLSQASLQTGKLGAAVGAQMALNPIASLFLGTLAFDEKIHDTASGTLLSLASIGVMIAGLVVLAAAEQRSGDAAVTAAPVPG